MNIKEENLKAVGLIKSRKSDAKIMKMAESMYSLAEAMDVELLDVVVDETANTDIDREEITAVCSLIEKADVSILILQSLDHLTDDEEDLDKFMSRVSDKGIAVVDMENKVIIIPSDSEESEADGEA